MAKERIGKIQRWILRQAGIRRELRKHEVLFEYFGLEPSFQKSERYEDGHYFDDSKKRNTACASYVRTKQNMIEKGLIEVVYGEKKRLNTIPGYGFWTFGPNNEKILLTDKGKRKANEIIHAWFGNH